MSDDDPEGDNAVTGPQAPGERRTTTVQIGKVKLTGLPAVAVLVAILALIVGLVVYLRPSLSNWPLWVSGALSASGRAPVLRHRGCVS